MAPSWRTALELSERQLIKAAERMIETLIASSGEPLQRLFLITLILVFVVSGCATPIGVRYVEPRIAHHSLTANVLSAERPAIPKTGPTAS